LERSARQWRLAIGRLPLGSQTIGWQEGKQVVFKEHALVDYKYSETMTTSFRNTL
jgi:hypothetical protein